MITLITLGYILPLIIMFFICYRSNDILTRRDLLSWWWIYLLPAVNIVLLIFFIVDFIVTNIKVNIDKTWWDNFLDERL